MAELNINSIIAFKNGFIVNSSIILSPGVDYQLNIQYPGASINRTYRSVSATSNILDTWGTDIPMDGDIVCFTLNDIACPSLGCIMTVG